MREICVVFELQGESVLLSGRWFYPPSAPDGAKLSVAKDGPLFPARSLGLPEEHKGLFVSPPPCSFI